MLVLDNTAISEARLIHPTNDGYFVIGQKVAGKDGLQKWTQKGFHMTDLEHVLSAVKSIPDLYISQSSFVTKKRVLTATKSISACFIDIDCYTLGILPDEALVQSILELADLHNVARPSYVMKSGCGLYAKWILNQPLSAQYLPDWNHAQEMLIRLFSAFGADPKARDAARVLRASSTINSKNGEPVEILYKGENTYNFIDLIKSLSEVDLPATTRASVETKRRIKIAQSIEQMDDVGTQDLSFLTTYSETRAPFMLEARKLTTQNLNWSRFLDLRDLMIRRGGAKRGYRDLFIFWMTATLASARIITPENLWKEVEQLLSSFPLSKDFDPLRDGSLSSLIGRVQKAADGQKIKYKGCEYSPIYTPTNDRLLNLFEITSEEETHLRTIISTDEKRRRADLKVPGRSERREQRNDSRCAAITLHEQGLTQSEIATQIHVDRSTISRWLKSAKEAPKKENRNNWDAEQMQAWKVRRQEWLAEQAHQLKLLRDQEAHLGAALRAQENLKISIKIRALVDKALQRSEHVCKQDVVAVSSVRKTGDSQSGNSDDADN